VGGGGRITFEEWSTYLLTEKGFNLSSKQTVEIFRKKVLAIKLCWFKVRHYPQTELEENDKHNSFKITRVVSETYFYHKVNIAISNFN
jgi:hypothetical protein